MRNLRWGANIGQWIRPRLQFYGPGFESQAYNLHFNSQILYYICYYIKQRTEMLEKGQVCTFDKGLFCYLLIIVKKYWKNKQLVFLIIWLMADEQVFNFNLMS